MTDSAPVPAPEGATIYPTHTCFDDVVDYLNQIAYRGASREELLAYTVVHGILVMPDGSRFAHAWLEHDGKILDGGIYQGERVWIEYSLTEFRGLHVVEDETRYTLPDAERLDDEFGPGPWKPKYRALCSDKRRVWTPAKEEPCAR